MPIIDEIVAARGTCNILDIGGKPDYWFGLESVWQGRPCHFTLLNLEEELNRTNDTRFTSLEGDGCDLSRFSNASFDLIHSNSTIEHVGGWWRQLQMADEIRRVGRCYFVQTPNFWFPFEVHFRFPFIHWLPEPLRVAMIMHHAYGFYPQAQSLDDAHRILEDARLLDARSMARLFPDAVIERERIAGLTKSLIAVR